MLTRRNTVAPQQEYYNDSLLTKPTFGQSVFDNLAQGFSTPLVAATMLNKQYAMKPEGQAVRSAYDAVSLENETPGIGTAQWLANEGANMLGFALNPLTWGLAGAGGLLARGVTQGIARVAPDAASVFMRKPLKELISKPLAQYVPAMVGKEGFEKPLSLSLLSEKSLSHFGSFAGAAVPQGIVDNFNRDTANINWGGVAREAGEMGAFGIAIGAIPFTWGLIRGKVNRGLGKEDVRGEVTPDDLSKGYSESHITKAEHEWYQDYLKFQKDPGNKALEESLKERGSLIINENGHTANTVSNEALFDILKPEDMKNLQGVIADQLTGDVPEQYRKSLSDFVIHNRLDDLRENPQSLDGVRGYVDFINQKLEKRRPKLEEADKILDDHLLRSVKNNMAFSQKELFRYMRKVGFESSHVKHLPVTIPENMERHLRSLDKISKLKKNLAKAERSGESPNKQTLRRIEELEKELPKILTPKEELSSLRQTLLSKGVKMGFERSNAYHRLLDLSNVWHNARTLLDRVHLEYEYNRQEAFSYMAQHILKVADSDMPRLSRPENVINYLKERIESNLKKVETKSDIENPMSEYEKIPADADTVLNEQETHLKETKAEDAKEDFLKSSNKFREFNSSGNIFKNFISCVLGSLNG